MFILYVFNKMVIVNKYSVRHFLFKNYKIEQYISKTMEEFVIKRT